jgi:hypothetical protein
VTTILLATCIFALALLGMSVGVLFGNRRIKGSCGGVAGLDDGKGKVHCGACRSPSPSCQGTAVGNGKEQGAN